MKQSEMADQVLADIQFTSFHLEPIRNSQQTYPFFYCESSYSLLQVIEWQIYISTVRAHIGRLGGRSTPLVDLPVEFQF